MPSEESAECGRGGNRYCPDCGSEDIYAERSHGDTICRDCGWYTDEGGPNDPVDWGEIHGE